MAPDWAEALEPWESHLHDIGQFLRQELADGHSYRPDGDKILRAFSLPMSEVKVIIVGQDPYPTPGHAIGLSFAVDRHVTPLPGSLRNIFRELSDDLGIPPSAHGDLSYWFSQGVLLLNRVLTVRTGSAGSHRGHGWEEMTYAAVEALVSRGGPLVAVLWGRDAHSLEPVFSRASVPVISSAHPSPLSARAGFFGSRPFSRVNQALLAQGALPIDWSLPQ